MIDLSGLQDYVKMYPELLGKLMNRDSILRYLVRHLGATPGKYRYKIWLPTTNFQECCKIPTGSSSLDEREANVVCIQDGDEYCELDLAALLREGSQQFGAGRERAEKGVEAVITEQQLNSTLVTLDRLVMLGDTAHTENNLNRTDGLIKLATTSGDATEVSLAGIESPFEMIKRIVLAYTAIPDARLFGNIQIFMGTDLAAILQMELVGLNLYNYNPGMLDNFQPFTLPGLAHTTIVPTNALDGTGQIFASPERNLHWLTNVADDHMNMLWDYDNYREVYFWRIKFLLGLAIAFPEYIVMGKVDDGLIRSLALNTAGVKSKK